MSRWAAAAPRRGQGGLRRRTWTVALAALTVALFAGWWWGRGLQAAWTARQLVEAIMHGDCTTAAKYSSIVPLPQGCPPHLYGLPDNLDGYSLYWDRVKHDGHPTETAVSIVLPGRQSQYGLHMVRKGEGWVVTETIVLL